MCVSIYIYVYIYINTYIYIYSICIYVYKYNCVYVNMLYVKIHIHKYIYIHTYIYIYIYIHIHRNTHIHPFCLPPGKTNKKEWDRFDRQIKAGGFPQELQVMLKRKKTDLFGLWIDFNEDWDRVAAEVERTRETSNLSRKEWEAVQAKTLKSQMSQEKFDDLVKKRKESGLYYQDDDYPNDELDRGSSKNDCFRSCLCFK